MLQHWLSAARLRTLPLALSSILMGCFLASSFQAFSWKVSGLCILTTIFLQVLSNFANDYGDTQNGADLTGRIGPERAVQSGAISPKNMLNGIYLMGGLALLSGIWLLVEAFEAYTSQFWSFLGLGLASIIAAYTYTAGKKPYGYAGLGDLSVFIFFGLVGVLGTFYLHTKTIEPIVLLPAISCGAFATAVLNINNIRDISSDQRAGKITIPVRLGKSGAISYHWFLLFLGMGCAIMYAFLTQKSWSNWLFLLAFPLFILNGKKVSSLDNPDPMLKQMALSTLLFVILFGVGVVLTFH